MYVKTSLDGAITEMICDRSVWRGGGVGKCYADILMEGKASLLMAIGEQSSLRFHVAKRLSAMHLEIFFIPKSNSLFVVTLI